MRARTLALRLPSPPHTTRAMLQRRKRLIAERTSGSGWVLPQIVEHMLTAPDFHFDSISQIRMKGWSRGRCVLVGDAGYSVALASGQGTSVAMVGAYVLTGELAAHKHDLPSGIRAYERDLHDYVLHNQDIALAQHAQNTAPSAPSEEDSGPSDFGALTLQYELKDYADRRIF